jgi:hypothetical protein
MTDKMRLMWQTVKAWALLFFAWNWKKYSLYTIAFAAYVLTWSVNGCNNPNPQPFVPPSPPEPDIPPLPDYDQLGWIRPTKEQIESFLRTLQTPYFSETPAGKTEVGELYEQTTDALVFRLANRGRSMTGQRPYPVRSQGRLGICVGCGSAAACEYSMAATGALRKVGPAQELPVLSEEAIYGFSRWEIHGNRRPQGLSGDGSLGVWAARALSTYGTLERRKYPSVDLSTYSEARGREWGDRGVPDELEPIAREQTAISVALVRTTEELKKALGQGYAAFICSDVGFGNQMPVTRDADGFLRPQGNWNHCMAVIGYRGDKAGYLILNSWGTRWVQGPVGPFRDIPDGSFWCDEQTMSRILAQGDSYVVSGVKGFPRRKLQIDDWYADSRDIPQESLTVKGREEAVRRGYRIIPTAPISGQSHE